MYNKTNMTYELKKDTNGKKIIERKCSNCKFKDENLCDKELNNICSDYDYNLFMYNTIIKEYKTCNSLKLRKNYYELNIDDIIEKLGIVLA